MNPAGKVSPGRKGLETLRLQLSATWMKALLAVFRNRPSLLTRMGSTALQLGNYEQSIRYLRQSLDLRPNSPCTYVNLGLGLERLGKLHDALACYNQAIAIDPDFNSAIGRRDLLSQRLLKQIDNTAQTIDAQSARATSSYEKGKAFYADGKSGEALACYDQAIALKPAYVEAHNSRGIVLRDMGRFEDSLASYDRAINLNPGYANAYGNRGNVLRDLGRLDDALASYDRAITLDPNLVVTHINRGNVLQELKQFDAAIASHNQAILLKPDFADAYNNRGVALQELNRLQAAIKSYDQAIALKPDYADAHFYKSMALLAQGDYGRGWALYEWRWRRNERSRPAFTQPLWLGEESLHGKSIFLHAEQGLGDTIQFCRYAKLVSALGATVTLGVQAPLKHLLANVDGTSAVVAPGEALSYPIDYHCPLMSLPLAFKTNAATIPALIPYTKPDKAKVIYWQRKLGNKSKPRVGVVWSGGFRPNQPELWDVNSRRNLPLDRLKLLKGLEAEFYSLQKGEPAESEFAHKATHGWDGPSIMNHVNELEDFSDTAALIENLDLVISVDTSTAHLAAALGKPVWILNRFDSCWRWFLGRSDSPWYPTVKLYRQEKYGDWDGVMERVKLDLLDFCAALK